MKIIVDVREHGLIDKINNLLLDKNKEEKMNIQMSTEQLPIGDIFIRDDEHDTDIICIERKTFADLIASIKDGRYEEQSYRLANSMNTIPRHRILYIIEGVLSSLSSAKDEKLVLSAMTSIHVFKGFGVWRTSGIQETAKIIVAMTEKIGRDIKQGRVPYGTIAMKFDEEKECREPSVKEINESSNSESFIGTSDVSLPAQVVSLPTPVVSLPTPVVSLPTPGVSLPKTYSSVVKKVKKENLTPENMAEIVLSQIPGIGTDTAIAIMRKMRTLSNLFRELANDSKCLENIVLENGRKINKGCASTIIEYLQLD